jgi:putative hydrolase of the HAD superfamily
MQPAAAPTGSKPVVNHIETWVFDLDNTLYCASTDLFSAIDRRMAEFISHSLRVDTPEARRIQKDYFRDYGTTLRGLMLNHGTDPERFLEFVHAIDVSVLSPDAALDSALSRLEGMKYVFTNGSLDHAVKVMERLGVARHFDAVFDIAAAGYLSKPDPAAYRALIERHNIRPAQTAIFEDLSRNLAPAAEMGMTTVWVRNRTHWVDALAAEGEAPDFVHHETDDLVTWLEEAIAVRTGRRQGRR